VSSLLSVRELSVGFGGVKALDGVSLDVEHGNLVGLIGPNGAGKTTFIDALTGFVPATGQLILGGRDLTRLAPHERIAAGLRRTWQTADLFDDLTLRENLTVAAERPSVLRAVRELLGMRPAVPREVDETLALLGLGDLADALPSVLTLGQRKLAGVARALVGRPRLICLDEPAAGLDTAESAELGRTLRSLADSRTSMILVDHDMGLVMGICDHIVVLEFGKVIAAGNPEQIRTDPRVIEAYLGGSHV
jgi:branched-chain amino acid transport system ATP-binding protein